MSVFEEQAELIGTPMLSHRFMVTMFITHLGNPVGVPSPLDLFFQRVSGLGRNMSVSSFREGGQNVGQVHLPEHVSHGNLVLERGVMTITPLSLAFNAAMSEFDIRYLHAVVIMLDHKNAPVCNWVVRNALPVSWQVGDLDATSNKVLINRMELAYEDIDWLGTKL